MPQLAPMSLGPTLTIGEILVEMMADTQGSGMSEVLNFRGPFPSGAPAIFSDQVARLGAPSAIIGAVGNDDFGECCRARLIRDGVLCTIENVEDLPTGVAFVRYRSDGGRAFLFFIASSAAAQLSISDATRAAIEGAGHLHVMGSSLGISAAHPLIEYAIQAIRAKGGTISFDPNVRPELLGDLEGSGLVNTLLETANVFLPSGDELSILGKDGPEAWLAKGGRECVLKQGSGGATAYLPGRTFHETGMHVKEIDPTGAGDCFGAAYVTCRRMGMPVPKALRYANAAGAHAVTKLGPMEGAATFAQLEVLLLSAATTQETSDV